MSRRRRARGAGAGGESHARPAPPVGGWERALRGALFAAIGLLLLAPFVVTPGTVFPFVVGKALWSRSLIEVAFALWAVLALARPAYRPPRSRLLAWLGLGLGVSLVSAAFGVSPQASLWSDYERMLGVIDQAHWFALAVVLASVLRTGRDWRRLLGAVVVAGTAVACLVIARALGVEVPFYGALPEPERFRLAGPFGNPTFLAVCLMAGAVLAAGFAARAGAAAARLGWAGAAALHLWGLVLAGSVGGFAGLAGAVGFAALAFARMSRGRSRAAALAVLAALALSCAALGARFLDPGSAATVPLAASWPGAGTLRYMGGVHIDRPSVRSRLAAWEAGLEGFSERPLLGFGPGNYATVFGLFGSGYAGAASSHDLAHGKLVEVAATTGAAGLAAWLGLWWFALSAVLRAARATASAPERAFTVCAGAALAGHLVQVQFLFDTVWGSLVSTLLLAFAATLEPGLPLTLGARLTGRLAAATARVRRGCARLPGRRLGTVLLGAAAVALALAGLAVNRTILKAADKRHVARDAVPKGVTREGIEAFPPLAGFYRNELFSQLALSWPGLRARSPALAGELLAFADGQAAEAVRREPWNWRIEHLLAGFYRIVAGTEPGYGAKAGHHLARARALAPARDVFPARLAPPSELASTALPGGRVELRWRPSPGAGYHQIGLLAESGARRAVLYAYGAARPTFIAPAGPFRYRIKACRHPKDCSAWRQWP